MGSSRLCIHDSILTWPLLQRIRNHAVVNCDTLGDMKALQLENARLQRLLAEAQSSQAAAAESAALAQAHVRMIRGA